MTCPSGLTLVSVLWFVGLLLVLNMASAVIIDAVQARIQHNRLQQDAAACAVSGADYAAAMVRWGKWKGTETFTSPDLAGSGTFTVAVSRQEARVHIHSIGQAGDIRQTLERTMP